jgi:hypothetical protein
MVRFETLDPTGSDAEEPKTTALLQNKACFPQMCWQIVHSVDGIGAKPAKDMHGQIMVETLQDGTARGQWCEVADK